VMACNRSGSNPGRVKDRIGRGLGIELFALNGRFAVENVRDPTRLVAR
jgi:hypothetical protein